MDRVQSYGALAIVVLAMLVVSGLAWRGNEAAAGALIGVISGGVAFYLRGRVSPPAP